MRARVNKAGRTGGRWTTYHHDGGLDAHALFDDGAEVGHLIEEIDRQRVLVVALAHALLLFPDLCEDLGVVDEVLEAVHEAAAHRVLRGKQER